MKKALGVILMSLFVWSGCFYLGTDLSRRRPLGSDELYTHINTVEPLTHQELLSGKGLQGNNGPLFYLIQKTVTKPLGNIEQGKGKDGQRERDERSQVLLRSSSNAVMSGAVALMYLSVAWFYSVPIAFLAMFAFLSFPGTWLYWTQAQPYSLWVLMTVLQSVFLLRTVHDRADKSRAWIVLLPVNILLSLCNVLGVLQVCAASFVIWAVHKKRWVHALGLAMVPTAIGIYYLQRSNALNYWAESAPVMDKFPFEYWVLVPILLGVRHAHRRLRDDPWMRLDLWVLVFGILLLRAVHTYIDIVGSGTFWHMI